VIAMPNSASRSHRSALAAHRRHIGATDPWLSLAARSTARTADLEQPLMARDYIEIQQLVAKHADLPLLPRDENGPVFAEPWQAQAFAVVVELTEKGVITRDEWAQQLGETLSAAEALGETDTGRRYYDHWLTTLERIVVAKEIAAVDELEREGREIRENDHHRREHQLHGGHSHE
jgi:nitrile hydratase accessory protein